MVFFPLSGYCSTAQSAAGGGCGCVGGPNGEPYLGFQLHGVRGSCALNPHPPRDLGGFSQGSCVVHHTVMRICYCLHFVLCPPHTLVALNYFLFGFVKHNRGSESQEGKGCSEMSFRLSSAPSSPPFFSPFCSHTSVMGQIVSPPKTLKFWPQDLWTRSYMKMGSLQKIQLKIVRVGPDPIWCVLIKRGIPTQGQTRAEEDTAVSELRRPEAPEAGEGVEWVPPAAPPALGLHSSSLRNREV